QALSSVVHAVPAEEWFGWQAPDPSHASGSSQSVSELSPHAVPADTLPPSTHAPEPQLSALTHSEAASPHDVPSAAWFDWHTPEPLHESGSSHSVSDPSPQGAPAEA